MQKLALVKGAIKHYDWGGVSFIPSLLQVENPQMKPFAEYWMGVHPGANCVLTMDDGREILLREYISTSPGALLGASVNAAFGQMPYLLKVLDVKDMLSIQVHPSKSQAALDFEAENRKGVPLDAPHRNYRDANHKPELMVALSGFYLLHGFKPEAQLLQTLEAVPELHVFIPVFKQGGYKSLYKMAMEMAQEEVNALLQPLINRIIPLYLQEKLDPSAEDFWAARAAQTFIRPGSIDRGIFSIYFFNIVHLKTGEAIFQDAGVPHAYLEGYNVEIMASSDNVLRGGLTSKHIDTAELLKHTKCEATHPQIIPAGGNKKAKVYPAPVPDFELHSYELKTGDETVLQPVTAELFLLTEGEVELTSGDIRVVLKAGSIAAAAFPGAAVKVLAGAPSLLFRATVPL
ncbi:mannose-6-phosphate isomerase, class I [Niabella drilacis]|uniref:mannose-6-phosphate isomerase n=1 Tax=Niabella drilacis (strain DSM 25811 / CCM 8410 / CCUG 62505 / LMG 26954 / E90) TaxID=1285928 RepID=A0A1G6I0J1_NIADE|nr:mannose-6-phosphate isomerase, class I [Niabella drilacis]SDB99960.1 mannose-6-phosphate isomerase, type 1 [Niabella drilacis]